MKPEHETLEDLTLLDRLAEHADDMSSANAEAFADMLHRLQRSPKSRLTPKQRQWAETVYLQSDIGQHYVENLVSSGKVQPSGKPHVLDVVQASRALKPPGR